jgi:hypothetical protein
MATEKVKKYTMITKTFYFKIHPLQVYMQHVLRDLCWKFLCQNGTCLCWMCSIRLWLVMISDSGRLLSC